jgi:hypothetical protein
MIKVADILIYDPNCSPHKFLLSGANSNRFVIFENKLYFKINNTDNSFDSSYDRIDTEGDVLPGQTYNVTVSISDLALRVTPISKNFSLTISCDFFW